MTLPHYQGLAHYGVTGIIFQWFLLTATFFRVTRFITDDEFPPMAFIRKHIQKFFGETAWTDLILCGWCVSIYVCSLAYLLVSSMFSIPLPVFQAIASMGLIGLASNYAD